MNSNKISLTRPDDWHLHLRDEELLLTTVPHSAKTFGRGIIMPNLQMPVTTVEEALAYRDRILRAIPAGSNFQPLMTLYLTDTLPLDEINAASLEPTVVAVKYYPAGATTNAANGVTAIDKVYPVLERMEEIGMPLLVHGESTATAVDIFDREQVFIDTILQPLLIRYPRLKLVLEHITTSEAVEFVKQQMESVAATITVHHLLYNRNHLLAGGVRPHFYCLPILKRDTHQRALIEAAISGNPKFFLGTDSAPHSRQAKENACACAGIYSAPAALELYAQVFEQNRALDKLEGFASFFGADFYGLPRNQSRITLSKTDWTMAEEYKFGSEVIVPICAGENLHWLVEDES
ncbi:MAG TPA: dihydroorotase [Gammaproteobacteria bacterium]|nr:dihydroorotase [Gammaproteobacteria bacterium]